MNKIGQHASIIGVVSLFAAVVLTGCNSSTDVSAKEVVQAAVAAAEADLPFHLEAEFTLEMDYEGDRYYKALTISGDVQAPERTRFDIIHSSDGPENEITDTSNRTVTVTGIVSSDFYQEYQMVRVGNEIYTVGMEHYGNYLRRATGSGLPFYLELLDLSAPNGNSLSLLGEQDLDGERVYHLEGPAGPDTPYPWELQDSGLEGRIEYWIGTDDYLVRRVAIEAGPHDYPVGATLVKLTVAISLSEHGEFVQVKAPRRATEDDHANDPESATPIRVGEGVMAMSEVWLDVDYFRFRAEEGRKYHITVDETGPFDTEITLYGQDGVSAEPAELDFQGSYNQSIDNHPMIIWLAPASGTYYLGIENIRDYPGSDQPRSYILTINALPVNDDYGNDLETASGIKAGETIQGTIGDSQRPASSDQDFFKFVAEGGRSYRIDLTWATRGYQPEVFLYGSEGVLRESSNAGSPQFTVERILWTAPAAGFYHLSAGFSEGAGPYTLTVVQLPSIADDYSDDPMTAAKISVGELVEGAIDYEFDLDYFAFDAYADQGYRIDIDWHGQRSRYEFPMYDPSIFEAIYDPAGRPLEYRATNWEGSSYLWTAAASGEFYLGLSNAHPVTGDYSFTVTAVTAGPDDHGNDTKAATRIQVGEEVDAALDHEFDLDYFRFPVEAGKEYWVDLDGQMFDSSIRLVAPDGTTEITVDGNATRRFLADRPGDHYFIVHSWHGDIGAYRVKVIELE